MDQATIFGGFMAFILNEYYVIIVILVLLVVSIIIFQLVIKNRQKKDISVDADKNSNESAISTLKLWKPLAVQVIIGLVIIIISIYFLRVFDWGNLYQIYVNIGGKNMSIVTLIEYLLYIVLLFGILGIIIPIIRYKTIKDTVKYLEEK